MASLAVQTDNAGQHCPLRTLFGTLRHWSLRTPLPLRTTKTGLPTGAQTTRSRHRQQRWRTPLGTPTVVSFCTVWQRVACSPYLQPYELARRTRTATNDVGHQQRRTPTTPNKVVDCWWEGRFTSNGPAQSFGLESVSKRWSKGVIYASFTLNYTNGKKQSIIPA